MKEYVKEKYGEGQSLDTYIDYFGTVDIAEEYEETIVDFVVDGLKDCNEFGLELLWGKKEWEEFGEGIGSMIFQNYTGVVFLEGKQLLCIVEVSESKWLDTDTRISWYFVDTELEKYIAEYKKEQEEKQEKEREEQEKEVKRIKEELGKVQKERREERKRQREMVGSLSSRLKKDGFKQDRSRKGNLIQRFWMTYYWKNGKMYNDITSLLQAEYGITVDDISLGRLNNLTKMYKKRVTIRVSTRGEAYVVKGRTTKDVYDEVDLYARNITKQYGEGYKKRWTSGIYERYEGLDVSYIDMVERLHKEEVMGEREREEKFKEVLRGMF